MSVLLPLQAFRKTKFFLAKRSWTPPRPLPPSVQWNPPGPSKESDTLILNKKSISVRLTLLDKRFGCCGITTSTSPQMELGETSILDRGLKDSRRAVPLGDQEESTGSISWYKRMSIWMVGLSIIRRCGCTVHWDQNISFFSLFIEFASICPFRVRTLLQFLILFFDYLGLHLNNGIKSSSPLSISNLPLVRAWKWILLAYATDFQDSCINTRRVHHHYSNTKEDLPLLGITLKALMGYGSGIFEFDGVEHHRESEPHPNIWLQMHE